MALAGLLLTVLFTTGLGVALSYAVLKSGSVLLAAYLHALNDQVTAFLVALGFKPFNPAFSFGAGIYGVVILAIIALLILRGPIWRGKGGVAEDGDVVESARGMRIFYERASKFFER